MHLPSDDPPASANDRRPWRLARGAAAVALARLRFLVLAGGLLGLVVAWPFLQNYWGKLTRTAEVRPSVSADTEYWCPMCPGVVSDWPTKCPVCSMSLVRRQKGEMTPLPDGVVARVQLSPYRLQLAGIRTSPVEYRRLEREVVVGGLLEAAAGASTLTIAADVFEPDARLLTVGQEAKVSCDANPGEPVPGRAVEVVPAAVPATGRRVRVRVENPRGDLRPGLYAAATFRSPVSRADSSVRLEHEQWRDAVAGGLLTGRPAEAPLAALLDAAARQALAREGYTLCVPESAVIDTGTRRAVFVEAMPGMFDAIEVRLGRRCGDFYPVLSGLEPGQRVATAGAVLLDAETRLNPSLAASYFGAGPRSPAPPAGPSSPDDKLLAERQKLCPVTEEPLDSMGGPVKLVVEGRVVFICCKGCEARLRAKPGEYLKKLPK